MLAPTAERPRHLAYNEVFSGLGDSNNPAGSVMHALSWSTGSIFADAIIGGAAGYFLSPSASDRWKWMLGGGVATGAAGALGLLATAGLSYARRPR